MVAVIFFDLETTGTDPSNARIWQASFYMPGRSPWTFACNPGETIPAEVAGLCHLTPERLREIGDAMPFAWYAEDVAALIHRETLAGFNCLRFDVPILAEEFERAGVAYEFGPIIDTANLFKIECPRDLSAAVRHYTGGAHDGAHDAEADVIATARVWERQQGALGDLSHYEAAEVSAFGRRFADPHGKLEWVNGRICYAFGKARGKAIEDDPGFARWMQRQGFPLATMRVVNRELERIKRDSEVVPA